MIYDNIVIGGGASALMLCAHLNDKSKTLIIEKNSYLGAKILISGGGRCNFTNKIVSIDDYLGDSNFLKPILKSYSNRYLLKFFEQRGLKWSLKNSVEYFCKNSAKDLLNILKKEINGVEIALNCEVKEVKRNNSIFKVICDNKRYKAKRVIVASGGLSFPKLGATDIGFKIAKSFDINVNRLNPALVGFTIQKEQSFFKKLSGISIDSKVVVDNKEFNMPILFTHKGISGPAILNASLFWQKGFIKIDFLPNHNLESFKSSKKSIVNTLPLPKKFLREFLIHLKLDNKEINRLNSSEFEMLKALKNYTFAPAGTFGYSKAEVTKGGVDINELNPTFESKKVSNLFFIGEVVDITGRLGGFNFTWAFGSAIVCAKAINRLTKS